MDDRILINSPGGQALQDQVIRAAKDMLQNNGITQLNRIQQDAICLVTDCVGDYIETVLETDEDVDWESLVGEIILLINGLHTISHGNGSLI